MRTRPSQFLGIAMAATLFVAACQDQATQPSISSEPALADEALPALTANALDLGALRLSGEAQFSHAPVDAIDPSDYVCSTSTGVRNWLSAERLNMQDNEDPAVLSVLNARLAFFIPFWEAIDLETVDNPQYFGYDGEYTKVLQKTERDTKRFWDIFSDDIQLIGAHGSMLLDAGRVSTWLQARGLPEAFADAWAQDIRTALLNARTLNGGDHPLFTFNALAVTEPGVIPDKIIMGDGVMAGYEAIGFGDVAPQAVYAHEFAHHIQFENDYFSDPVPGATTQAELTRYTELMADAMSAYYLTHKRGATMNQKRVEQFLRVFFDIGDCSFSSGGHHGTPNQRMAAAYFGFAVADEAQKKGHILTSEEFHDRFVAEYPNLIAPDAP